jgi:hypothetical protein
VPNAKEISLQARAAHPGREQDSRTVPTERLYTSHIEARNPANGNLLADIAIPAYVIGFVDDTHYATFTTNANDEPQIEIWEMKLKR